MDFDHSLFGLSNLLLFEGSTGLVSVTEVQGLCSSRALEDVARNAGSPRDAGAAADGARAGL